MKDLVIHQSPMVVQTFRLCMKDIISISLIYAHSAPYNNELVTCDIRPDIDCHEVIEDWIMSNVSNVISSDIVQTLVPCLRRPGTSI